MNVYDGAVRIEDDDAASWEENLYGHDGCVAAVGRSILVHKTSGVGHIRMDR